MYHIYKLVSNTVVDFAAEELKKYLRMMMPRCGEIDILYQPDAVDGFRLGLLSDFLAFKLCNEWLPAGGFITSALMHYSLSPIVIPVLLFFALLCGFTPCFLEYLQVRKQMQAEDTLERMLREEQQKYQTKSEDHADV